MRDFLDEDELREYDGAVLQTKAEYDTFGRVAKDTLARTLAQHGTGAVPLLVPDVMMTPVSEGIGVRLLLRMGWRQGKGLDYKDPGEIQRLIGHAKSLHDIEHVMDKGLRASNTRIERMEPKLDMFGLGYDPFEGAEEFRHVEKRGRQERHVRGGIAFGTGVVEDQDDIGMIEDYVSHDEMSRLFAGGIDASGKPLGRHQGLLMGERLGDRLALEGYTFEIQDDVDDSSRKQPLLLHGDEPVKLLANQPVQEMEGSMHSVIRGFVSVVDDILPAIYPRPRISHEYRPRVPSSLREKSSLQSAWSQERLETPSVVPENPLKGTIDQIALQVARSGPAFERVALSAEDGEQMYSFITPGDVFHPYYIWKVQRFYRMAHPKDTARLKNLDSSQRRVILGEPALEKTFPTKDKNYLKTLSEKDRKVIEERMSRTFVKSTTDDETNSMQPGLSKVQKPVYSQPAEPSSERKIVTVFDLSKPLADATVVSKEILEKAQKASSSGIPIRRVDPWDPEPLLCKRLGIEPPRRRSSLQTQDVPEKDSGVVSHTTTYDPALEAQKFLDLLMQESENMKISDEAVGKPTHLFQAIFEEEEDETNAKITQQNTIEQFKPVVLPANGRRGKEEGISASRMPVPREKKASSSPSRLDIHKKVPDTSILDDERIKEALRIVQEAERRKRERRERKKQKHSSRHRHSRDRKRP